ncbi:hypothetical protein ACA910_002214 [Epithemia clementina (nom. ined.)]
MPTTTRTTTSASSSRTTNNLSQKEALKELGASKKQLVQQLNISWKDANELLEVAQTKLGTTVLQDKTAVMTQAHQLHQQRYMPEESALTLQQQLDDSNKNQMLGRLTKLCEGQQCLIL